MCKSISDLNFNSAVIDKISDFNEFSPKFHLFTKIVFLKYFWKKIDQLL